MKVYKIEVPEAKVVDLPRIQEGTRWCMKVELTFDILPDDITEKYEGDAEVDFSRRALSRVREQLEGLIAEGKPFAHYHIVELPVRKVDF